MKHLLAAALFAAVLSATAAPALIQDSWRQIRPDDPIFD